VKLSTACGVVDGKPGREAVDGRFPQHGKESRFRTSNGRLTVGMTWEEAQEEEAYAHMVEEILSSHKGEIIDELLESHKDEIIDEFISERMTAYYRHHPNLTVPADTPPSSHSPTRPKPRDGRGRRGDA
jgi:hypothetical protein